MKKKLNEIFDEAKPQEIDQFSDELNAPELPDEVLASVKGKVYAKTKLKKENKTSKSVWLRFGAIAACFLLIVSVILAVPMLREDDPGVIPGPGTTDNPGVDTPPNSTTNNDNPGNIRPLHWDDVSSFFGASGTSGNVGNPAEMYEKVFYEITSGVYSNYKDGSIISDDCVGEKIDTVVIRNGWYQSWNDEERDVYEVNAEVYTIEGIDSTVAVAIKYLENPHGSTTEYFYVYSNPYGCDADSLSGFYETYDADQYMSVYTNAHIREYDKGESTNFAIYDINKDALDAINTQFLNLTSTVSYSKYTDTNIKAIESITNACKERLQISVELKSAGRYGVVYVLDNGYICFMGFGDFFVLHGIGSDAAQTLIETVKNNSVCLNPSVEDDTAMMQPD